MERSPLSLTVNARLDHALQGGWTAWGSVAEREGIDRVTIWIASRLGGTVPVDGVRELIETLLAPDDDDRVAAQAELAELAEGTDDEVADVLWEGVLARGLATGDDEVIFEATERLAGIAEDHGDPLAAAEFFIDFLNWRRQDGHVGDPEAVESAFDEIVRLAEADGEPKAAAIFAYRQAGFTRLLERDEEAATVGDWERDRAPYTSWA